MTIETLINGIASMLDAEFGLPVHTERVEQDLDEPGFFVRFYRDQNAKQIGWRYMHSIDIEVLYFPPRTDPDGARGEKASMADVSGRLNYLLLVIDTDSGKVRTRGLESNVSDGTLVTTFTVDIPEKEARNPDLMMKHHTVFKNTGWRTQEDNNGC